MRRADVLVWTAVHKSCLISSIMHLPGIVTTARYAHEVVKDPHFLAEPPRKEDPGARNVGEETAHHPMNTKTTLLLLSLHALPAIGPGGTGGALQDRGISGGFTGRVEHAEAERRPDQGPCLD